MEENFKVVEEILGEKLVQIDSFDGINITNIKNIESLSRFAEVLNPSIVLCVKKTIDEKIAELIPKVIEANLTIGKYLFFLQEKVVKEGHSKLNDDCIQKRYFELYDALSLKLINSKRAEEVCSYQLFFPVNGIFLTTGMVCQDWLKYSDLFSKHQDDFLENQ